MNTQQNPQLICKDQINKKTKKHLLVCSMAVRRQAGKHISDPIKMIMKGNYIKERERLHKILDLSVIVILILTLTTLGYMLWPKSTPDFITLSASVAPEPITTGDISTLTFEFENSSNETIRNAQLSINLPEHFKLTEIETQEQTTGQLSFALGNIAPNDYGYIHIKGVMFGDVDGEQIFTTSLSYTYSENNLSDTKINEHIFSPSRSALELELKLPETLVAYQELEGRIIYKNTGTMEFPKVVIDPQWPADFTLLSSSPSIQSDGLFHVNEIEAGEEGVIEFTGRLGSELNSTFSFDPSFSFEEISYKQTSLVDTVTIVPSPLQLTHAISGNSIIPGESAEFEAIYKNVSDFELSDITFKIKSDTDIFSQSGITSGTYSNGYLMFNKTIDKLAPGEQGSLTMTVPIKSSISRSAIDTYSNIQVETVSYCDFSFTPDKALINVNTKGSEFTLPLTSPIILNSFARYWGPNGDQLGRGPVPPITDETTKYWIFWNISGTTNELSELKLEADLGQNVTLTGRQSISKGSAIEQTDGVVKWSIDKLEPTLPPTSQVVGIAFEVAITPSQDQVGTVPMLIGQTRISAKDNLTGEYISNYASAVTTELLYDTKAAQYGGVVIQ
jgi:hypothetical protein